MGPSRSMTLAIVEDDEEVRRALARLLRAMGHDVKMYRSAEEFEAGSVAVDCAIVDVRLPGVNGLELCERLRRQAAPTAVVLITGDGDRLTRDGARAADAPLVTKPFDDVVLTAAIADAIATTQSLRERHAH